MFRNNLFYRFQLIHLPFFIEKFFKFTSHSPALLSLPGPAPLRPHVLRPEGGDLLSLRIGSNPDGEGPRLIPILLQIPQIVKYYPDSKFLEVIKVADLPIAAVVRIARKNGVERVGSDAAAALVVKTEDYIASLVKEANRLAIHAGRKTLKDEDIELAVKAL